MKKANYTRIRKYMVLCLAVLVIISLIPITLLAVFASERLPTQIVCEGGENVYEDGKVKISKQVRTSGIENEFFIDLTVTTTDKVDSDLIPKAHAAVVLAVDVSSSMDYCVKCGANRGSAHTNRTVTGCPNGNVQSNETRIYAAVEAAKTFLADFRKADAELGEERYASLVFFGTSADLKVPWTKITNLGNSDADYTKFTNALNSSNITLQGGTFMQGGLLLARNLYSTSNAPKVDGTVINNRFVILLTDGDPNCRVNAANEASFVSSNYSRTTNISGVTTTPQQDNTRFAENRPSVVTVANHIKNGVSGQTYDAGLFTIAFQTGSGFTVNNETHPAADAWLRSSVAAGSTYALYAGDTVSLNLAFEQVVHAIRYLTKAWHVYDPMARNIEFLGVAHTADDVLVDGETTKNDGRNLFDYDKAAGTIDWNLLTSGKLSDDGTVRVFKLTYKIRLDNITENCYGNNRAGVVTNGRTYLTYLLASEDGVTGEPIYTGSLKEADFKIPKVRSFAANLRFPKVGQYSGVGLAGYVFDLKIGGKTIRTATSDRNGVVSFYGIPSGHDYTLSERAEPNPYSTLYGTSSETYGVNVSFGKLTSDAKDGQFTNPAKNVPVDLWKYFSNADLSLFGTESELACDIAEHTHDERDCYGIKSECDKIGTNDLIQEECDGECQKTVTLYRCQDGCPHGEFITSYEPCDGTCLVDVKVWEDWGCEDSGECEDPGCPHGEYIDAEAFCDGECLIETKEWVDWPCETYEDTMPCDGNCLIEKEVPHVCDDGGECLRCLECEIPEHTHVWPDCFVNDNVLQDSYTFMFTIEPAVDNPSEWADSKPLTLSGDQISSLIDYGNMGKPLMPLVMKGFFVIPADKTGNGKFIITETTGELGWATHPSVEVNLNNVTTGPVTTIFNNEYGEVRRPWFIITKELSIIRGSNSDTFNFALCDEDGAVIQTISASKADGYKTLVTLGDAFLNADGRKLTLEELAPDTPVPGMRYDTAEYKINIDGGVARIAETGGKTATFHNVYFERITPEFTIQKITNDGYNGEFIFDYTYEGSIWDGVNEGTFSHETSGSGSVTLNTAVDGFTAQVKLSVLTNFTGWVTVTEKSGTAGERWEYDENEYGLWFQDGVLSEGDAMSGVVSFTNTYTPPGGGGDDDGGNDDGGNIRRFVSNNNRNSNNPPPDTVVPETDAPLAEAPPIEVREFEALVADLPVNVPENTEITEEAVPRSVMPQTGVEDTVHLWIIELCLCLLGVGTLLCIISRVKRKQETGSKVK